MAHPFANVGAPAVWTELVAGQCHERGKAAARAAGGDLENHLGQQHPPRRYYQANIRPNPKGIAVFDAHGNTAIILMRSDRPKFAANNRDLGTPEEFKTTVQGTHAYFGTYSVIEKNKTLVFHVEGNTFPNQEGIDTERLISFKVDEFTWITPKPSVGGKSEAIWKRVN